MALLQILLLFDHPMILCGTKHLFIFFKQYQSHFFPYNEVNKNWAVMLQNYLQLNKVS